MTFFSVPYLYREYYYTLIYYNIYIKFLPSCMIRDYVIIVIYLPKLMYHSDLYLLPHSLKQEK